MKKILSVLLALTLLLSLSAPVFAAENGGSMDNFRPAAAYGGQFADVASTDWEYPTVKTCYEYGLMKGSSENAFLPDGTLSVAEAIALADRVHEIYHSGQSTIGNGSPWYQPYVDYAAENGIIEEGAFSDYNAKITRAEMAVLFYRALPASEFTAINTVERIADLSETPERDQILELYRAGILTGNDIYGSFNPNQSITRGEASAIIAREAIPEQRRSITLMEDYVSDLNAHVDFVLPQGTQDISEDDEVSVFVGDSCLAVMSSDYDESSAGTSISEVSPEALNEILVESLSQGTASLSGVSSTLVNFSTMQVYRTTGIYSDEDIQMDCVLYTWLSEDGHLYIAALMSDDDSLLKTMANYFRIYGTAVTQKL